MQVGVDHQAHIRRGKPSLPDAVLERRAPLGARIFHAVNGMKLRILLIAKSRVDQDEAVLVLNEQTPHTKRDAVLGICGEPAFPQRLRHDPKHGATVELLAARLDGVNAPAAKGTGLEQGLRSTHVMTSSEGGSGNARRRRSVAVRRRLVDGEESSASNAAHVWIPERSASRSI